MKLAASIRIAAQMAQCMDKDELQDYVLSSLSREISKEVSRYMDVTKIINTTDDTITYTGTITAANTSTVTVSGYNGTSSPSYSQINLRVVEYTKNGKVTRVELQKYDAETDDWFKIPRLQIEE